MDTEQLDKQNPMKAKVERWLGRIILAALPMLMLGLAGWIYRIGNEITDLRAKISENDAQWKVLHDHDARLQEVRTYKLLFKMLCEENHIKVRHVNWPGKDVSDEPVPPRPEHKQEEFKRWKHEQVQQMAPRKGE